MRLFALSDLHVDNSENMSWLEGLSAVDFTEDALIISVDVSHDMKRLQRTLESIRARFADVFFVPGNHELWLGQGHSGNSVEKFWDIVGVCSSLGIHTRTGKIGTASGVGGVWVVPLYAWYLKPEEGGGSLFVPKEGEDPSLESWSDNYFVRWQPTEQVATPADYFLRLNEESLQKSYDAPVISFSHFLPRKELMFSRPEEDEAMGGPVQDIHPGFNFSRVAGCAGLDDQIRRLGSTIHVYGHQHRHRNRVIDGVRYISHCLGYPHERTNGQIRNLGDGPLLIWDSLGAVATNSSAP
jgi:hypothetical protein